MTDTTRIHDLTGIDVEHGLSAISSTGFVTIRAAGPHHILLGQVDPAAARSLATDLTAAAARAEYEQDLLAGAVAAGFDVNDALHLVAMVRAGEHARETGTAG